MTFFTKKNEFKNPNDYFYEVAKLMKRFTVFAYYFAFPQLIRFMKDENKMKKLMDKFYYESLHEVKIRNDFIFHSEERYKNLFDLLQRHIQTYVYNLLLYELVDLNIYMTYLKDLNITYYNDHHDKIFYVQKDYVKNMYHMVSKTKTADLLKMNWLLKLGFSRSSQKSFS